MKPILIAADHGGYALKSFLVTSLEPQGFHFEDLGTDGEASVDYPDFAHALATRISDGESPYGILICGSGNGIQMSANKHPNVRAALCWKEEIAHLARQHNDANILVLPGRFIDPQDALACFKAFFSTDFEGGRHEKRVQKINL